MHVSVSCLHLYLHKGHKNRKEIKDRGGAKCQ